MSQTFYKLWIHLIWRTKDQETLLPEQMHSTLYLHITHKAYDNKIHLDTVEGTENHIHCLISLHPTQTISNVADKLKGESSHWINFEKLTPSHFAWQGGYFAFSVSESQVEKVRRYIRNQKQHHRKVSFAEEVNRLLKLHNTGNIYEA